MRSEMLGHTLLPKRIALPVFASDALSSVAYAPDEILLTLAFAGLAAVTISPWVALAVVVVLGTVIASYRQNVHAYPSGGGDYEVASENLGKKAGLAVASALLVDYVLTVAVSISSASQYVASALPALRGLEVEMAVAVVVLLAIANLRGLRESGRAFAVPTYIYMVAIGSMAVAGFIQYLTGSLGGRRAPPTRSSPRVPSTRGSSASRVASSCSGPSPRAVRPSRGWRRSPTACPRSRSPSRATPPQRSSCSA